MASIRRTLSPATPANGHDPPPQTLTQIKIQRSSSSSSTSCSSSSSPLSAAAAASSSSSPPLRLPLTPAMRLLFFFRKKKPPSSRKHHHQWTILDGKSWKKSFLRFFLFFLLGFLLGLSPFASLHHADLKPHHFFFDSVATTKSNPHRNLGDVAIPHPQAEPDAVNSPSLLSVQLQNSNSSDPNPKLLIIVTPTYNRALQAYYLNRLGQTLRLLPPPVLWIVVEMKSASTETADILRRSGVTYRHLVTEIDGKDSLDIKDRGVHQRNTALRHIEHHLLDGIVYFADDDNIYSLQLFHQLRNIRRFGTWPVAMLAQGKNKATLEGPVCNRNHVIGWHTNEKSKRLRRFHVDMSGFAFNSTILWDPKRWRRPSSDAIRQLDTVKEGFQETTFIEQIIEDEYQMEGLPHNCSKIMNWHLHLEARHLLYPKGWQVLQNLDVVNSLR